MINADVLRFFRVHEDGRMGFLTQQELSDERLESIRRTQIRCVADLPVLLESEKDRLIARDERAGTIGKSYRKLNPFHWQDTPELPVYASDIPSPVLDILIAHTERMQRDNVMGYFCGAPIVTLDKFGMEVDERRELVSRIDASSGTSIPAEILPGEIRCEDGIIRRTTAAETVGYDTYHNQTAVEAGQQRVSIADGVKAAQDGAMVYFRPNGKVGEGEYALVEVAA